MTLDWLKAAQRLRAIAQTGLTYTTDAYDRDRYGELTRLAEAMLADLVDAPPERVAEAFSLERGYPTPKIDVRMATFVNRRVLLVREASDGRWTLPGGWADETDTPRQAAERETREESGYVVRATRLVAVNDRNSRAYRPRRFGNIYKLLFLGELRGGEPQTSLETSEVGFFELDALPPLSTGRTLPDDIQSALDVLENPELPTRFD